MRRWRLEKHLVANQVTLDESHPYAAIDLSRSGTLPPTIAINGNADLLVECGAAPLSLYLIIGKGADLKLQVIGPSSSIDWSLNLALDEGASLAASMADFSSFLGNVTINGELHGRGARLDWHLASLARQADQKKYIVNFSHRHPETYATMRNFGVIEDKGRLTFTGKSHILKGAWGSSTHQTARIMVFDSSCVGKADPILAIDDNDVSASHAATVGKINEEHMFYLRSRGLRDEDARHLITFGYLAPAIEGFSDSPVRERLTKLLRSRL